VTRRVARVDDAHRPVGGMRVAHEVRLHHRDAVRAGLSERIPGMVGLDVLDGRVVRERLHGARRDSRRGGADFGRSSNTWPPAAASAARPGPSLTNFTMNRSGSGPWGACPCAPSDAASTSPPTASDSPDTSPARFMLNGFVMSTPPVVPNDSQAALTRRVPGRGIVARVARRRTSGAVDRTRFAGWCYGNELPAVRPRARQRGILRHFLLS
jgi:hypothetical protein